MYRNDVKKVRFFRDGDANFSGVNLAISRSRYRNFDSLLNDLSRRVPLPFGVRTLHTPGGVHHVYNIDQIEDGKDYVCSTFHKRPIKRINYAGGSANRASWRAPQRRGDESFRSEKKIESGEKLFQVRNLKPKTITVIARDDSANRAKMILNRRTAMTYDSVLQTVSDILQLNSGPVKDLYTLEGKKVGGIADLIHGPDVFLASGRNSGSVSARSLPSRLIKKKSTANSISASSKNPSKSAASQNRKGAKKSSPYTQPIFKKKEKKVKGNPFVFTVRTSDKENAGTQGQVSVVVCGAKGCTGELTLGPPSSKTFEPGSNEEFEVNVGNIGKIHKLRVMHSVDDDDSGWHLQEILMTSLARTGEEHVFECDKWFSNKDEGNQSVIEFPAMRKGSPVAKVIKYEITVMTGEFPSAGTDSNVFITIFGEMGDTGKRWLKNTEDGETPFAKGRIDVFTIEAVSLGKIKKILIGHDNKGDTPGWYLEKLLIKDTELDAEYSFPCRRFLDEDEGDGKTETILKASVLSDAFMSPEELWEANDWKFQDSNEVQLVSLKNGNGLKVDESSGEVIIDEETEEMSNFVVTKGGDPNSRIFTVQTKKHDFHLTLDDGKVNTRMGRPGLLSEFYIEVQKDSSITLESVVHRGSYLSVSESGQVEPAKKDCDKRNLFDVRVKGSFRNLGRIRMKPFQSNQTIIESNGNLYGDGEVDDEGAEFVVHKVGDNTRAFQSASSDKFISVKPDDIDCKGEDKEDTECHFRIHKDKKTGLIRLESVKMPGVFFGIGETGRVKHAVDAGDKISGLNIEIISFGDKKPKEPTPEAEAEPDYDDGFEEDEENQDRSSSRGSNASEADRNDRSSSRGSNASEADKNDRSSSRGSNASEADKNDRSSSRGSDASEADKNDRSSSRGSHADSNSPKKSKYEEGYGDDDYEDDGSRPASQKSESRPVTRASSKANSAASSRPETVTSNKADSRPASAKAESRSSSRLSNKSAKETQEEGTLEENKEENSKEDYPNSDEEQGEAQPRPASNASSRKSIPFSARSASGASDKSVKDDSDKEGTKNDGDENQEESASRPASAASRKADSRPGSRRSESKLDTEGDTNVDQDKEEQTDNKEKSESRPVSKASSKHASRPSSRRSESRVSQKSEQNDEENDGTAEDVKETARPASSSSRRSTSRPTSAKSVHDMPKEIEAGAGHEENDTASRPASSLSQKVGSRPPSKAETRPSSSQSKQEDINNDDKQDPGDSVRPASRKGDSRPASVKPVEQPGTQELTENADDDADKEGTADKDDQNEIVKTDREDSPSAANQRDVRLESAGSGKDKDHEESKSGVTSPEQPSSSPNVDESTKKNEDDRPKSVASEKDKDEENSRTNSPKHHSESLNGEEDVEKGSEEGANEEAAIKNTAGEETAYGEAARSVSRQSKGEQVESDSPNKGASRPSSANPPKSSTNDETAEEGEDEGDSRKKNESAAPNAEADQAAVNEEKNEERKTGGEKEGEEDSKPEEINEEENVEKKEDVVGETPEKAGEVAEGEKEVDKAEYSQQADKITEGEENEGQEENEAKEESLLASPSKAENSQAADDDDAEKEDTVGDDVKQTETPAKSVSRGNSALSGKSPMSRPGSSKSRPASQRSNAGVYEGLVKGQSPPISREGSAALMRSRQSSRASLRKSAREKKAVDGDDDKGGKIEHDGAGVKGDSSGEDRPKSTAGVKEGSDEIKVESSEDVTHESEEKGDNAEAINDENKAKTEGELEKDADETKVVEGNENKEIDKEENSENVRQEKQSVENIEGESKEDSDNAPSKDDSKDGEDEAMGDTEDKKGENDRDERKGNVEDGSKSDEKGDEGDVSPKGNTNDQQEKEKDWDEKGEIKSEDRDTEKESAEHGKEEDPENSEEKSGQDESQQEEGRKVDEEKDGQRDETEPNDADGSQNETEEKEGASEANDIQKDGKDHKIVDEKDAKETDRTNDDEIKDNNAENTENKNQEESAEDSPGKDDGSTSASAQKQGDDRQADQDTSDDKAASDIVVRDGDNKDESKATIVDSRASSAQGTALSPTPPKTPRSNSAARRPTSRLSNPNGSRPGSRISVKSPSKIGNKEGEVPGSEEKDKGQDAESKGKETKGDGKEAEGRGQGNEVKVDETENKEQSQADYKLKKKDEERLSNSTENDKGGEEKKDSLETETKQAEENNNVESNRAAVANETDTASNDQQTDGNNEPASQS